MPEYMLYMNAVGSFLKPGLVEQKTETPKADSPDKGWQKVISKKKNRNRQFKPKVSPSFSEFVKSYNPFDKLRGEGKTTVGISSELGKEKTSKPVSKPVSKPIKPRRVREGFCELCRLPGHVKKYCWTYPEEDISDKPCDICEGRHGASPCYFDPEMYNKYHEGQPPRELYIRRAEETRQVVVDEIGPHGEFTIRRCTLQGVITLGREGSIWALTDSSRFPYPFFLVPVGPGDHSATPSEFLCKRQLQTPTLTLYQRKGIYGILGQENPLTLSLDIRGELSPTLVLILRTVVGKAHPTLVGRMSDKDPTKLE